MKSEQVQIFITFYNNQHFFLIFFASINFFNFYICFKFYLINFFHIDMKKSQFKKKKF